VTASPAPLPFDSSDLRTRTATKPDLFSVQRPSLPITPDSSPNSSVEDLPFTTFSTGASRAAPRPIRPFPQTSFPATPPLTPDNGSVSGISAISARQTSAALDIVTAIFPRHGLSILPHAKAVKIASPGLANVWDGVILELPDPATGGKTRKKTLYVDGKGAEHVQLKESVVAILDLADEHFACSAFVIALDKSSPALSDLLHSLMYVGGTVVSSPPFEVDPRIVLVGMEM